MPRDGSSVRTALPQGECPGPGALAGLTLNAWVVQPLTRLEATQGVGAAPPAWRAAWPRRQVFRPASFQARCSGPWNWLRFTWGWSGWRWRRGFGGCVHDHRGGAIRHLLLFVLTRFQTPPRTALSKRLTGRPKDSRALCVHSDGSAATSPGGPGPQGGAGQGQRRTHGDRDINKRKWNQKKLR